MRLPRRQRAKPYRAQAEDLVPMAWTDPWTPTHRDLVELWLAIAKAMRYRVTVTHDSRGEHWGADSGWPDVFVVRDGRAYAIEIKVPPDDVTDEQGAWIGELDQVPGIFAGIFRSSGDRARDTVVIADILRTPPPTLPSVPRGTESHL